MFSARVCRVEGLSGVRVVRSVGIKTHATGKHKNANNVVQILVTTVD